MRDGYTQYYFATEILKSENCGKQDNITTDSIADTAVNKRGNDFEKQKWNDNKAKVMYQLWGDNFVSDSLH